MVIKAYGSKFFLRIKPRADWGAQPPMKTIPLPTPVKSVVIFGDSATEICETKRDCIKRMQEIQKKDMAKGYPDIKHNFFIGLDGRAYEGTGWTNHGVNIRKHPQLDGRVFTICHIGNFAGYRPFWRMRKTVNNLIKYGVNNNYIRPDYRRGEWLYEERDLRWDDEWFKVIV